MGERHHHQQQQQQQQLHNEPAARDVDLDDSMEDEDDDTVVGTCLHCSAPPPPRSSSRVSGPSSNPCGTGSGGKPCSTASTAAMTSFAASCPPPATRVQVSCDDCRSFICDGCHWCHEFQANHEIRVCDRCDAFYCRGCDEMDQCEDCSEVVCNTCSTLMSCKFCGCGLCEDCATACGRCGIVLCARDAKFAVECDTCRMSYCLVCLASGTKDPCVRCGHRPTKRVEQLVHLRLKSIYKAFKQSGASMGPGPGVRGSVGDAGPSGSGRTEGKDISTMGGKYSAALRSLLTENGPDSSRDSFTNFDQSMASEVAAVLQTASNSMANSNGGDHAEGSQRSRGKRVPAHDLSPNPGGAQNRSASRASNAAAERYFRKTQAEMEAAAAVAEAEAEAAAAALLAELDEEKASSNAANTRKSKKKKKKKSKDVATTEETGIDSSITTDNVKSVEHMDEFGSSTLQKKKVSSKTPPPQKGSKASTPIDEDSSDEEMNFEQLVGRAKSGARSKKEKKDEVGEEKAFPSTSEIKHSSPPLVDASAPSPAVITADFDAELAILLSNDDMIGLESFLADLKGIPGLAATRKTAKKALKKIKETKDVLATVEPEIPHTQHDSTSSQTTASLTEIETKTSNLASKANASNQISRLVTIPTDTTTSVANSSHLTITQHEPLLRVVSRTLSNVGTSARGSAPNAAAPLAPARAECVMHISPAVVGWVIGKGGSRIRDMMEESGAKIWIDQASMAAKESRVVYVSGKRSSVDTAVRMVKDLVAKAPIAAPTAAAKTVPVTEESSESTSFSSVITSSASTSAATPGPASIKQPPSSVQGWALPASGASTSVVPPQVAPQNNPVKAVPKSTVQSAGDVKGVKKFPPAATSELECDPRFVALLIGRRGWTVKNIQAESGASLRIDQAVDPPKIIISGSTENVKKAERMVRDVLRYPHSLLNLENLPQAHNDILVNSTDRPERQENVADSMTVQMTVMPLPVSQHDVVASSTPKPLEVPLHQELSHQSTGDISSQGAMNYPPIFAHYESTSNNLSSFKEPSSGPMHPLFLSNDHHQPVPTPYVNILVEPDRCVQIQGQEWGDHNPSLPVQNQFSTLPPFSSMQVGTRDPYHNMLSNLHSSLAHQPALQDNRMQSTFALLPDQRATFPSTIHNITSDLSHNVKGWDLPANSNPLSTTWNQSHHSSEAQAAHHTNDNPFQQTQHPQQTYNNQVSDDSLMVDNMFASLVASKNDGNGLLVGLNSVSLEGAASQQSENWGSKITDWTGVDTNTNLPHSRLSDYREEGR